MGDDSIRSEKRRRSPGVASLDLDRVGPGSGNRSLLSEAGLDRLIVDGLEGRTFAVLSAHRPDRPPEEIAERSRDLRMTAQRSRLGAYALAVVWGPGAFERGYLLVNRAEIDRGRFVDFVADLVEPFEQRAAILVEPEGAERVAREERERLWAGPADRRRLAEAYTAVIRSEARPPRLFAVEAPATNLGAQLFQLAGLCNPGLTEAECREAATWDAFGP